MGYTWRCACLCLVSGLQGALSTCACVLFMNAQLPLVTAMGGPDSKPFPV